MRNVRGTATAWAAVAILPFLVGFAPPDSQGTYVSIAAGQGHYLSRSATGCSPPRLVDYRDIQAGVRHQFVPMGGNIPRIGLGADVNAVASEEKVCITRDCEGGDSVFQDHPVYYAVGAYWSLDWRWFGGAAGVNVPIREPGPRDGIRDWMRTPLRLGMRVGPSDVLYASWDLGFGAPLLSDGAPVAAGIGGRLAGMDLWAGGGGNRFQARIARAMGPLRVRLTGSYGRSDENVDNSSDGERIPVRVPEYGVAMGLEYRIR